MGDLGPILIAVIGSTGTIVAAIIGARRIVGRSKPDRGITVAWKEQAELEKARADLLAQERDDERSARSSDRESFAKALAEERLAREGVEAKLVDTRHDYDDCVRQRDDAFSELRLVKRPRPPRPPARGSV